MKANSKKYSLVEATKVLFREEIKKKFPTYDAAIAEIDRLQSTVNRLELDYQLATHKPRRGRPRGQSKKKEMDQIHKAFPFLSAWIRQRVPLVKGGRPSKNTRQQMIDFLKEFDDKKQCYAKEKRKKSITDKEYIEFQINIDQKMKGCSELRRREEISQYRNMLKYYRDETGIRQKRKTP